MSIKKIIAMTWAATAAVAAVNAQSFNPQVEVTNTYRGKLVEVQKAGVPMALPDSLLRFDYHVDYAVFDHPYSGSYDFHPYLIEMKPDVSMPAASRLYLNAGAGYTFAPTVDFAWSSVPGKKFSGTLYDDLDGYYGPMKGGFAKGYKGSLFTNRLGATGHYDGGTFKAVADVAYDFLGSADSLYSHSFHAVDFSLRGGTAHDPFRKTNVHAGISVSYGNDTFGGFASDKSVRALDMDMSLGFTTPHRHYPGNLWAVDVELETVRLSGAADAAGLRISALPKYVIERDNLHLAIGVCLSTMPGIADESYNNSSKLLYPDVHAEYQFNKDRMAVFAHLSGGERLDSYRDYLRLNPYFAVDDYFWADASVTRADLNLGLRGCAFRKLEYKADWGYAVYESVLNETLGVTGAPAFVYSDHALMYYGAELAWRGYKFDFNSAFKYRHAFNGVEGLDPAALTGRFDMTYRWTERLAASVYGRGSSKRTMASAAVEVPGWFDLGLKAEYQFTSGLSFWLGGDNLLCSNIYEYAFRARKCMCVTAGICLNIR